MTTWLTGLVAAVSNDVTVFNEMRVLQFMQNVQAPSDADSIQ